MPILASETRLRRFLELRDRIDAEIRAQRKADHHAHNRRAHRTSKPDVQDQLVILGITAGDVKRWAVDQGLATHVARGRLSRALLDAYQRAHGVNAEVKR